LYGLFYWPNRPISRWRLLPLALRAVIGARELDQFLADKDAVAGELEVIVRQRVAALGLEVMSLGNLLNGRRRLDLLAWCWWVFPADD
jgi:hypothetical protein